MKLFAYKDLFDEEKKRSFYFKNILKNKPKALDMLQAVLNRSSQVKKVTVVTKNGYVKDITTILKMYYNNIYLFSCTKKENLFDIKVADAIVHMEDVGEVQIVIDASGMVIFSTFAKADEETVEKIMAEIEITAIEKRTVREVLDENDRYIVLGKLPKDLISKKEEDALLNIIGRRVDSGREAEIIAFANCAI